MGGSDKQEVIHYTDSDGFKVEVSLVGLNNSVILRSNRNSDSVERLLNLGLNALYQIKNLECDK